MGQSGTSQQSTVPGVRIDLSQIKGTTRFNDLQEDLQKELTALDGLIRRCMEQKSEIDAFLPAHGEQVAAVGNDVAYLADKHRAVEHALEDDLLAVSAARNVANRDADAARLAFAAVDVLRLPAQYHHHVVPGSKVAKAGDTTTGPVGAVASALDSLDFGTAAPAGGAGAGDTKETSGPSSIVDFFAAATSELSAALSRHEALLADVEARMRGLEADALAASTSGLGVPRVADEGNGGVPGTADGGRLSLADVVQLLRETEEVMVDVAGKVLGVREAVAQLPPAPAAGTARAYQGAAGSGRYGGRR